MMLFDACSDCSACKKAAKECKKAAALLLEVEMYSCAPQGSFESLFFCRFPPFNISPIAQFHLRIKTPIKPIRTPTIIDSMIFFRYFHSQFFWANFWLGRVSNCRYLIEHIHSSAPLNVCWEILKDTIKVFGVWQRYTTTSKLSGIIFEESY